MKKAYLLMIFIFAVFVGCAANTWKEAQSKDTADAYYSYLKDNPKGEFVKEASSKLEGLEDTEWEKTSMTLRPSFMTMVWIRPSQADRSSSTPRRSR